MAKDVLLKQYTGGFNVFMSKYRAQFIKEALHKTKVNSILDIGCGTGDVIKILDEIFLLVKKSKYITLVDPNLNYLREAEKKLTNVNLDYWISTIEDFKTFAKYDLIFLIDILEHVDNPLKILRKVRKFLSKNGQIVIIVPNAESFHRQIGKKMGYINSLYKLGKQDKKIGHKRYFDENRLMNLVIKADYHILSYSGILFKPFPNKKMSELSEKYCDALYEMGKMFPKYCAEIAIIIQKK